MLLDLGFHFLVNWCFWGIVTTLLVALYRRGRALFWGGITLSGLVAMVYHFASMPEWAGSGTASPTRPPARSPTTTQRPANTPFAFFLQSPQGAADTIETTYGLGVGPTEDCPNAGRQCWAGRTMEGFGVWLAGRDWTSTMTGLAVMTLRYGEPDTLEAANAILRRFLECRQIEHTRGPPYHPMTQGKNLP